MRAQLHAIGQVVMDLDRIGDRFYRLVYLLQDAIEEVGFPGFSERVKKRCADVEAISFAIEVRSASAGDCVLLVNGYAQPAARKHRSGSQPTHSASYYGYIDLFGHTYIFTTENTENTENAEDAA